MPTLSADCLTDFHMPDRDREHLLLRRESIANGGAAALGIAVRAFLWDQNQTLRIHFHENDFRTEVLDVLQADTGWGPNVNLRFVEATSASASDVRVSFRAERGVFWSRLGTQARQFRDTYTVSLGFTAQTDRRERRRLILHEFGHALGLEHEMKNARAGLEWKRAEAIAYYGQYLRGMSEGAIWDQLQLLANDSSRFLIRDFDPTSIMMYPIPREILRRGWQPAMANWNYDLSESDLDIAREMYPPGGVREPRPGGRPGRAEPEERQTGTYGARLKLKVDGDEVEEGLQTDGEIDTYTFEVKRAGEYEVVARGNMYITLTVTEGPNVTEPEHAHTFDRADGATYSSWLVPGTYTVEATTAGPVKRGKYAIRVRKKA